MRLFCLGAFWSNSAMESVPATTRKCIIILYNFLIIVSLAANAVADEADALLSFKTSLKNAVLQSWKPGTQPCNENLVWEGVICRGGSVRGIRLERLNLSGTLDVDALGQLHGLRTLSFMSNSFAGPIPPFNKLLPLKALFLAKNNFSGEIPMDYFDRMSYLKKVFLSSNQFSGPIPSSLSKIPLKSLHLENNQFSGSIPELNQPTLLRLNVSYNSLSGPIPPGLLRFDQTSFEGNPGICGEKAGKPCDAPLPPKGNENNHDYKTVSMWVMMASAAVLVVMVALLMLMRRKREKNHELPRENVHATNHADESGRDMPGREMPGREMPVTEIPARDASDRMPTTKDTDIESTKSSLASKTGSGSREFRDLTMVNEQKGEFRMADLMKATAEVLGNGSLGSSFKATISNGVTVVVKRVKHMNKLDKIAFDSEIRRLGRIKHKNILPPLAYHYRKEEKLLITEYMPTGSLLYVLHGDKGSPNTELKWPVRLKIIQGIARGLFCIHTELCEMELPHGNLKSCNVLLNDTYEPLLSDYGFNPLISSAEATQKLFAYKSPEALNNQTVSPASDIYCFGLIILELLTGKLPSQYVNNGKGGTDIVQWARSAIDEKRERDLFDPAITGRNDHLPEMKKLLHIGVACTEAEPTKRLDIRKAISKIEELH